MRTFFFPLAALITAAVCSGEPAHKSIYMITDAEGVAGVCRQEQTDPSDVEMRRLLVGEVNAAVEGFFAGGADEVVVLDGHGGSRSISVLDIHPKAKLVSGGLGPSLLMDRKFSAVAFVGQHAMANTRNAIMGHSFNSLGFQNLRLNGKPVGELEPLIALAGWFDTPVILVTGDQAAVDEYHAIVPGGEGAAVKEGLARYTCVSMSAEASRNLIRAAAERAMKKIGSIHPYKVPGAVTFELERTTRNSLGPNAASWPGTQVVDDRTIRYLGKDFFQAWTRYYLR